jgi:predicted permease
VLGRTVRVNGQPITIVGVAPPDFDGTRIGSLPDIFLPMMFAPQAFEAPNWLVNARNNWLRIMGRLARGKTRADAEAELTLVFRRFHQEVIVPLADTEASRRRAREAAIVLEPGYAGLFEMDPSVRPTLVGLMGLVAIVLLVASVNVAGLMAARAERLQRETAICLALGAPPSRVWSRHVIEATAVVATGLFLALLFAMWMSDRFVRLIPAGQELRITFDSRVVGASMGLGLLLTLALSAMAARYATRVIRGHAGISRALKGEDIAARLWLRKGLIVGQFALSIVVLAGAALFAETVNRLSQVELGFERHQVLVAKVAPSGYSPAARKALYDRLLDEVRGIPGVVSAALANDAPLDLSTGWNIEIPGTGRTGGASVSFVSPDYFKTMGIPLVRGRDFRPWDQTNAARPIIVNENFVRAYLGSEDGRGVHVAAAGTVFEIIGVARDSAALGLRDRDQHIMYVPGGDGVLFLRDAVVHLRASVPPATLQPAIEAAVRRLDPDIPVVDVRTIDQQVDRFMIRERTFAVLSLTFGVSAIVLCAVGLYGVIASAVSRRTRELGIRLALGATPQRISRLILGEAGGLAVLGMAIGIPCAVVLGRAIRTLLFGVQPGDWRSLAIAMAVVTVAAAAGACVPARRAARVDPLAALRTE